MNMSKELELHSCCCNKTAWKKQLEERRVYFSFKFDMKKSEQQELEADHGTPAVRKYEEMDA